MKDVTSQVAFENNDDESLPLTKCVCGTTFSAWSEIVGIYPEHPWKCPSCGVSLVFRNGITVHQVDRPVRLVCPTCREDRWAEIYPSLTDPTGFTLYCRHCEEGCVSPAKL